MIICLHLLGWLVGKRLLKRTKAESGLWETKLWCDGGAICNSENMWFDPPVYLQRYASVAAVLEDFKKSAPITKVVDFGCAELSFFMILKKVDGVEDVVSVDLDEETVRKNVCKTEILLSDSLYWTRSKPLRSRVCLGSADEFDPILNDVDVVVAIELVEHLIDKHLKGFPENIFGRIKPRLAVITTPNVEFNVLFPNFEGPFRHWDHKFEWTRQQFAEWVEEIISTYPEYTARLYGVGPGPAGTEKLGCCSQMAVFRREGSFELPERDETTRYKVISDVEFPFYVDPRSLEEKVNDEVKNQIPYACEEDPHEVRRIKLSKFLPLSLGGLEDLCNNVDHLRKLLESTGWTIEKDDQGEDVLIVPPYTSSRSSSYEDDDTTALDLESYKLPQEGLAQGDGDVNCLKGEYAEWDGDDWSSPPPTTVPKDFLTSDLPTENGWNNRRVRTPVSPYFNNCDYWEPTTEVVGDFVETGSPLLTEDPVDSRFLEDYDQYVSNGNVEDALLYSPDESDDEEPSPSFEEITPKKKSFV